VQQQQAERILQSNSFLHDAASKNQAEAWKGGTLIVQGNSGCTAN